ncbi:MAG: PIN domain-containing protein [Candidatus Micrarchaeota archaeon]
MAADAHKKLYLDSDVWITYFDKTDFRRGIVLELFEKIKGENIPVIVTDVHLKEMRATGYIKRFEEAVDNFITIREISCAMDQKEAEALNKKLRLGSDDCLHMTIAKRMKSIPVSYDEHWEKIGEELEIKVLMPGGILNL